ncbi:MAG TPA: PDZ domain-containing protein [Vicinamibacterales bacterium]|nr:PDZ domain-containing protein [Vicinamibacterales bacterium]
MARRLTRLFLATLISLTGAGVATDGHLLAVQTGAPAGVNVRDTRLLEQPAVSATHVAFIYAGDLWTVRHDGAEVRRLTTDEGIESNPVFSADGQRIAFSAQYEGNTDVYVVPVEGGVPARLTWHPGADVVQAFTPDGSAVYFTSARAVFTTRYTQLFKVQVAGGMPEALPIPNVAQAAPGPADRIAYNPIAPRFLQWKEYRGGTVSRIWIYDPVGHEIEKIPQPPTRSNDTDAMWVGNMVYFRSDRAGEFNIFSYDPRSKTVRQVTTYRDFPILSASAGAGRIVFEQAGYLHMLDPETGRATRLTIGVAADLPEVRPRFVSGTRWIRGAGLSPTGARAVFEYRGEIVTVPAEKGDPRNLTMTPAVHERSPAWSPDGTRVAYLSDEGGEYKLRIAGQDGRGDVRTIALEGHGFYDRLTWSPDSRRLSYVDNSQALYWLDLDSGVSTRIDGHRYYTPAGLPAHAWSPDSKWIAYVVNLQPLVTAVHVYSIDGKRSHQVTDGLSDVADPVFDRSGKYLFFFGSTDAGPAVDWFAQSNADMDFSRNVYLAVLRNDVPSPLARESDEEKGAGAPPAAEPSRPAAGGPAPVEPVRIDFDGLEYRILDVPVPAGQLSSLQAGAAGHLYYLRTSAGATALQRYDLTLRRNETLLPDVGAFTLSADGRKMLYVSNNAWSIVSTTARIEPAAGRIAVNAISVRIDPRAEWKQIFDEAWRINRDYFYAPNMHGVDWVAMKRKYEAFLPAVATRADLNRVLQWMSSELSVGHHRVGGGDGPAAPASVPGGLLGADYAVENGRYRFRKVYGGLNWNPQLRAPLTEPGVSVKAGEYLLAVRGQDVRPPDNLYRFFENTSGKIVEMTVGPNPDGTGSRNVEVVPIANESALRNRAWVEGNLRKVDEATGGRVAYVYVPNTAGGGHAYFKRYFFPQAHKDAIIVDERFNGGGQVADYYIDLLSRQHISYWAMRYGHDLPTPTAAIAGPKVMIIDETAGSGGDLLPWMFRKFELGPIVGQRTWGGLVGTLGFPTLMDGGSITAPNLAIWTKEDGWVVENEGVPPDIEVEQTPRDVINGRDPQLEKAIEVVLEALRQNPPADPDRPAYPVRGKTLRGTTGRGGGGF